MKALNLPINSDIIISPVTCSGNFSCITEQGHNPILVDADLNSYNTSLKKIKERITKKTKLIFSKGILFKGPPGVGKTLLAKAMAGESGMAILYGTGTDFTSDLRYAEDRVKSLFQSARNLYQPCIIFIDEIEVMLRTYLKAYFEKYMAANLKTGYSSAEDFVSKHLE